MKCPVCGRWRAHRHRYEYGTEEIVYTEPPYESRAARFLREAWDEVNAMCTSERDEPIQSS